MKYAIELTLSAEKDVLALTSDNFKRIAKIIDSLESNPRPHGVRKLKGRENEWRVRVGKYRIIYSIDDHRYQVVIYRVTDRKDVYRRR